MGLAAVCGSYLAIAGCSCRVRWYSGGGWTPHRQGTGVILKPKSPRQLQPEVQRVWPWGRRWGNMPADRRTARSCALRMGVATAQGLTSWLWRYSNTMYLFIVLNRHLPSSWIRGGGGGGGAYLCRRRARKLELSNNGPVRHFYLFFNMM